MNTLINVHSIYSMMLNNDIQFSYKGPITQDVLITLGDTIKEKMYRDDCDTKVIRRVFSVLVEAAHNILKYSYEKTTLDGESKSAGVGLIGISKMENNVFMIFSGNLVSSEEADIIERKLVEINALSKDELKQQYNKQLKQGKIKPDGSAGLGLYEVARRSDRPIDYKFTPVKDDIVFFELKIFIEVEG